MKRSNYAILILLSVLMMVSCNNNLDQNIPSEPDYMTKSNTQYAYSYLNLARVLDEIEYENMTDNDSFMNLITEKYNGINCAEILTFIGLGKSSNRNDEPYIKLSDGLLYPYLQDNSDVSAEQHVQEYSITGASVKNVAHTFNADTHTVIVDIEGLEYTMNVSSPIKWSETLNWDIHFELLVSSVSNADGTVSYRWTDNDSFSAEVTLNSVKWPSISYEPENSVIHCGDDDISMKHTVTFDANGGNEVSPILVNFNGNICLSDIPEPTKADCIFKEWVDKDGTPVFENSDHLEVNHDYVLYAAYYDEYLSEERLKEVSSMYDVLKEIWKVQGKNMQKESIRQMIPLKSEEKDKCLLKIAMFTNGEKDEKGYPYFEFENTKYYLFDKSVSTSKDKSTGYGCSISGEGSCRYSLSDNKTTETKDVYDISYIVDIYFNANIFFTKSINIPKASVSVTTVEENGVENKAYHGYIRYKNEDGQYESLEMSTYLGKDVGLYCGKLFKVTEDLAF